MRRSLAVATAGAALLVLGLAACGGDDGANGGGGSGSGSGAGSGSGSGSAASRSSGSVADGVARQYEILEEEVAAEGGETTAGDWRVAYIVEPAEPWFESAGSGYTFRPPTADETHHIEIIPIEAATGRVIPDVPIRLEILDAAGNVVDANDLNFYYAEFFHYANNFAIPEAGAFTLRATIEPPDFFRHGEESKGPALAEGVTVEFAGVSFEPAS